MEANAFAKSFPYEQRGIATRIRDVLHDTAQHDVMEHFALQPFMFNALCLKRKLAERIMTLVKAAYNAGQYDELRCKVLYVYAIRKML